MKYSELLEHGLAQVYMRQIQAMPTNVGVTLRASVVGAVVAGAEMRIVAYTIGQTGRRSRCARKKVQIVRSKRRPQPTSATEKYSMQSAKTKTRRELFLQYYDNYQDDGRTLVQLSEARLLKGRELWALTTVVFFDESSPAREIGQRILNHFRVSRLGRALDALEC